MAAPATLTMLAVALGQSPAWVRHHLQKLLAAGLVELAEVRTTGTVTEKFYRSRAGAYLLQDLVLPESDRPVVILSGSHDLGLERLAARLQPYLTLLSLPVGSLNGLAVLRQGLCQVSGLHLLARDGQYNLPFVQHLFPDREVKLITLAHRVQGLMVAPGNPLRIRSLADLARPQVRMVNRNSGSGTRVWLDAELERQGIPASALRGYERVVPTHSEAAEWIARGQADASLGLQAAAHQHSLDFLPLFEERFDLVVDDTTGAQLAPLLNELHSASFRREIESLTGYNVAHCGELINL